jgi:hypothetical protein
MTKQKKRKRGSQGEGKLPRIKALPPLVPISQYRVRIDTEEGFGSSTEGQIPSTICT